MKLPDCSIGNVVVQVFGEFEGEVRVSCLESVCRIALEQEAVGKDVSLVIADDDTVRTLNAEYRGLDKTTDVLSFAFDNEGEYFGEGDAPSEWSADEDFVLPPGECAGLGEVIVSYPQAARQAQEQGCSIQEELARLIAHGILHLIGHDHRNDDEEREMADRERKVMERLAGADIDVQDG